MQMLLLVLAMSLLVACSKAPDAAAATRNDLAATACEAYARGQLADKTYQLDHAVLAASLAEGGDGAQVLKAPIVIDPGLSSESRQTLECTVRFVEGRAAPDVLNLQFIW